METNPKKGRGGFFKKKMHSFSFLTTTTTIIVAAVIASALVVVDAQTPPSSSSTPSSLSRSRRGDLIFGDYVAKHIAPDQVVGTTPPPSTPPPVVGVPDPPPPEVVGTPYPPPSTTIFKNYYFLADPNTYQCSTDCSNHLHGVLIRTPDTGTGFNWRCFYRSTNTMGDGYFFDEDRLARAFVMAMNKTGYGDNNIFYQMETPICNWCLLRDTFYPVGGCNDTNGPGSYQKVYELKFRFVYIDVNKAYCIANENLQIKDAGVVFDLQFGAAMNTKYPMTEFAPGVFSVAAGGGSSCPSRPGIYTTPPPTTPTTTVAGQTHATTTPKPMFSLVMNPARFKCGHRCDAAEGIIVKAGGRKVSCFQLENAGDMSEPYVFRDSTEYNIMIKIMSVLYRNQEYTLNINGTCQPCLVNDNIIRGKTKCSARAKMVYKVMYEGGSFRLYDSSTDDCHVDGDVFIANLRVKPTDYKMVRYNTSFNIDCAKYDLPSIHPSGSLIPTNGSQPKPMIQNDKPPFFGEDFLLSDGSTIVTTTATTIITRFLLTILLILLLTIIF